MSIVSDRPIKSPPPAAWPGRALRWWLGELRDAWDDAARRLRSGSGGAITIEAGERYWVLRRKQRPIGHIDVQSYEADECRQMLADAVAAAGARAILVEIPPERVLSKVVAYPAGARGELDRIVEFDFPRHFPFPAERVLFRYRIAPRAAASAEGGVLAVEIVAVPREIVTEICGELAAAGLIPAGIGLVGAASAEPLFLPGSALPRSRRTTPPVVRRLAYAVPAMALIALMSWPVAQQARLTVLDRQIAELKPRADAGLKSRERQQQDAERLRAIVAMRGARPALVGVIDALSRDLPDGAWLLSLSISGRDAIMDGLSPSAAGIALALQKSGAFKDIVFRAPVTREAATGLERFQLGAAIVEAKP
jgi:general secretion pathway protein L